MKKEDPLVSVIVLNWNGKDYLRKCLVSLQKTQYPNFEVIVVDNASTDGSSQMVYEMFPWVKLIVNKKNVGFSLGNNIGIKNANGEIIVLLNNDTEVHPEWLNKIIHIFKKDPTIGIVGCILCFPKTDIIQFSGAYLHPAGYGIVPHYGMRLRDLKFPDIWEVDYVMGAALAIKRGTIKKIGLLDPAFFAYYEDVDWCFRVKKSGYKVVMCKGIVYHYGSAAWGRRSFNQLYLNEINRIRFLKKHFKGFDYIKRILIYELLYWLQKLLKARKVLCSSKIEKEQFNVLKYIFNLLIIKSIAYVKLLKGDL